MGLRENLVGNNFSKVIALLAYGQLRRNGTTIAMKLRERRFINVSCHAPFHCHGSQMTARECHTSPYNPEQSGRCSCIDRNTCSKLRDGMHHAAERESRRVRARWYIHTNISANEVQNLVKVAVSTGSRMTLRLATGKGHSHSGASLGYDTLRMS